MSNPVYIQQDYQMGRPFQQVSDMQHQQYPPVYLPNQFLLMQRPSIPQQLLRMPGVAESFGPFATHYSQNPLISHGYSLQQIHLVPPSMSSKTSPVLAQTPLPNAPMVRAIAAPQIQLPQQHHYASAFQYLLVPIVVGQSNPHRPASVPGFSSSGTTHGYPVSPSSYISDSKSDIRSDAESARLHLNPGAIDYSMLVGCTVSPVSKRRRRTDSKNSDIDHDKLKHLCSKCGKTFQKPYNLKSHMKTHSSERPFKCLVCPKTFARSHDRKRHELLHDGVKNFRCEGFLKDGVTKWGCGKKFARSDALARHFRTETGWLCIKPLMDEAKEQEQLTGKYVADPLSYLHHQIALPPLRNQY